MTTRNTKYLWTFWSAMVVVLSSCAACMRSDPDGVKEFTKFKQALLAADSALVSVEGYDSVENGQYTIDLTDQSSEALNKTLDIEWGPRLYPDPVLTSKLRINVRLEVSNDEHYLFQIFDIRNIRVGPNLEYFVKLKSDQLHQRIVALYNDEMKHSKHMQEHK